MSIRFLTDKTKLISYVFVDVALSLKYIRFVFRHSNNGHFFQYLDLLWPFQIFPNSSVEQLSFTSDFILSFFCYYFACQRWGYIQRPRSFWRVLAARIKETGYEILIELTPLSPGTSALKILKNSQWNGKTHFELFFAYHCATSQSSKASRHFKEHIEIN